MSDKITIINPDLPTIAIVGRPNVGKSTLFNRLIRKRKASVHDTPGLTRDRNYGIAEWGGLRFLLIDTGGYEITTGKMQHHVRRQAQLAIDEADLILFMSDIEGTINPIDDEILNFLRKKQKPFILIVNKCDSKSQAAGAVEFTRFGLDRYYTISAQHGIGINDVLDEINSLIPEDIDKEKIHLHEGIRIAVVGKQNVGKSTLVNKILGQERVITSDIPGTTRDSIDTTFTYKDKTYTLIDTAGLRRRGKIEKGVEFLSYLSSMKSIERSHLAILLIDTSEGFTEQDAHIGGLIRDAGCGYIIAANKWDKVEKDSKTSKKFEDEIRDRFKFLIDAPIVFISALTGQRVNKIFELINQVYEAGEIKIETHTLNKAFERFQRHLSPPTAKGGRQLTIKYVVQTGIHPPTFSLFVNDPALLHFSYKRYLINQMRQEFGFKGNPIKFNLRKK